MAQRPYLYGTNSDAGTGTHANVTNNSTTVVGTGTLWTSIAFGDLFSANGMMVPVLSITDDTHLELAYPWPGSTLTGQQYTISAGIADTDARRYGWTVQAFYQRLGAIPADTQTFRDQAAASATAAASSASTASASATLASAWASTAFNTDVPGATPGSRSALHYSVVASNAATAATTNGSAQVTLAAAQVTLAAAWASAPVNTDVNGVGTRSAFHWATQANTTYNNTVTVYNNTNTVFTNTQTVAATVNASVQLAADWAQKGAGLDVNGPGTRSSFHWSGIAQGYSNSASSFATNASNSAAAAASSASLLANPDFGFITDLPTLFADWGTVP